MVEFYDGLRHPYTTPEEDDAKIVRAIEALKTWRKLRIELEPPVHLRDDRAVESLYAKLVAMKAEFTGLMCWGFRDVEFDFKLQDSSVPDFEDEDVDV